MTDYPSDNSDLAWAGRMGRHQICPFDNCWVVYPGHEEETHSPECQENWRAWVLSI